MDSPAQTALSLNGRTIDLQRGIVTDEAGHKVGLRPQAAEVLKLLAARPGKLIGKDELVQAVWGNIAVTDDSLVQCITEIRKALGDDKHDIVRTLPKRGYLLEAEKATERERPRGVRALVLARKSWLGLAAGLLILIGMATAYLAPVPETGTEPPAIAVLPFQNRSISATGSAKTSSPIWPASATFRSSRGLRPRRTVARRAMCARSARRSRRIMCWKVACRLTATTRA